MVNTIGPTHPALPTRRVTRKSEANTTEMPMTEGAESQQRPLVYERRKGRDRRRERRKAILDLRAGADRRRSGLPYPSVDIDV